MFTRGGVGSVTLQRRDLKKKKKEVMRCVGVRVGVRASNGHLLSLDFLMTLREESVRDNIEFT